MAHLAFEGAVLNTVTKYVALRPRDGFVSGTLGWLDATSNATCTLEYTDSADAPAEAAGDAWQWAPSGETVTGPVASAAGVELLSFACQHSRARLKIVATADCDLSIWDAHTP